MGKKGQKRKLQAILPADDQIIEPEDLLITIDTLETLAQNPGELAKKYTKDVKRATFELHRTIAEGATLGNSLSSKISVALQDYRFTDALVFLFEMMVRGIQPKLGAVQRWVRECDATSSSDGSPGDVEALRCLDLILRIANNSGQQAVVQAASPVFRAREPLDTEIGVWGQVCRGELLGRSGTVHELIQPTPLCRILASNLSIMFQGRSGDRQTCTTLLYTLQTTMPSSFRPTIPRPAGSTYPTSPGPF